MNDTPLVSVIIPCYNHGRYLAQAIASVKGQSYGNIEVIVIDDGSHDNTKGVAESFSDVIYVHQQNIGLAASRNKGIDKSKGEYLVFLDADDILYPEAVQINLGYLLGDATLAFVSGAHDKFYTRSNIVEEKVRDITSKHYAELLMGNYISMIAAVMFRRRALHVHRYDTALKACEDYDIFLKISREFMVKHHTDKIAVYNIYENNMSGNFPLMLKSALNVLKRQKPLLRNVEEATAYKKGLEVWKNYFCKEITDKLRAKEIKMNRQVFITLLRYKPKWLIKYFLRK